MTAKIILPMPDPIQAQALAVYQIYPLKVARPLALRAITKAIKAFGFEFVLERTELYAKLRGGDKSFMPHPATWFNQERFNDDPSTWKPYENNTAANRKGFDRNKGTFNEGTAHLYKAKPI